MSEQSMIERVARAIVAVEGRGPDSVVGYRDGRPTLAWHQLTTHARAILQTMREPTEGMLNAIADPARAFDDSERVTKTIMREDADGHYRAMIDAALDEE